MSGPREVTAPMAKKTSWCEIWSRLVLLFLAIGGSFNIAVELDRQKLFSQTMDA